MFTIQSAMLALLGFLVAILVVLLLAPAYWRRAVRLTTSRIKQSMPLTEAEIRADKDRLRAEYAIKVHRLEAKAEQSALDAARQQIELNRRDAAISQLEGEIGRLKTSLEEHENARRVLEQTITDRFPMLEQRLAETRKTLTQREREAATLTETSTRQARALEEAQQLNTQQRDEVMRLNSSLAAIAARTREGLNDPKFAAEVALRTELESLKARLRDQSAMVERLQSGGAMPSSIQAAAMINGTVRPGSEELEKIVALARSEAEAAQKGKSDIEAQLLAARRALEDQGVELASAKAALAAYERGSAEERSISLKDSRLAMKVRIGALQAESQQQSASIQRMRSELAAAHEKLAKQAAHFMSEMRRLGAGGSHVTRSGAESRRSAGEMSERRSRVPRLAELARPLNAVRAAVAQGDAAAGAAAADDAQDPSRVRGFLKALGGAAAVRAGTASTQEQAAALTAAPASLDAAPPAKPNGAPRRLVDRLASVAKS